MALRHRGSVATSLLLKVANFRERASGGGVDTVQKPSFYPEFMVLYFRFLLLPFLSQKALSPATGYLVFL